MSVPSVDVRDVAQAHLNALLAPHGTLHGKRICLNHSSQTMLDLARTLHKEFSPYGYNPQTRGIGYCPLKMVSFFDT